MVYCPKCGEENENSAEYCTKCGTSLDSKKNSYDSNHISSLEKQVEDFAEEVGQIGRKAGKIIEQGAKNISEELKAKPESEEYKKTLQVR